MKTTVLYSPLFAKSEMDGKILKDNPLSYAREINAALEEWNDRFSDYLRENNTDIQGARFSFDEWEEAESWGEKRFLAAAIKHDDDISELIVASALNKLYNNEIAEEFSQKPVFDRDNLKVFVSLWNREESFILTKKQLAEKLDLRYKLFCRDCKYMQKIGNTDETGHALCTFQPSYQPTTLDTRCVFLPETAELRCGDCANFWNDFACSNCAAEDSAMSDGELCAGFIDEHENELYNILAFWKLHNFYSRERINRILDDFEKEFKSPLD